MIFLQRSLRSSQNYSDILYNTSSSCFAKGLRLKWVLNLGIVVSRSKPTIAYYEVCRSTKLNWFLAYLFCALKSPIYWHPNDIMKIYLFSYWCYKCPLNTLSNEIDILTLAGHYSKRCFHCNWLLVWNFGASKRRARFNNMA